MKNNLFRDLEAVKTLIEKIIEDHTLVPEPVTETYNDYDNLDELMSIAQDVMRYSIFPVVRVEKHDDALFLILPTKLLGTITIPFTMPDSAVNYNDKYKVISSVIDEYFCDIFIDKKHAKEFSDNFTLSKAISDTSVPEIDNIHEKIKHAAISLDLSEDETENLYSYIISTKNNLIIHCLRYFVTTLYVKIHTIRWYDFVEKSEFEHTLFFPNIKEKNEDGHSYIEVRILNYVPFIVNYIDLINTDTRDNIIEICEANFKEAIKAVIKDDIDY